MTDKNKLTSADLVIVKYFGEAAAEIYSDDYEKLDKYLKEHKTEDIPWFESEEGAEFAKKAAERFAPLVAEIAEKNRKSKAAFAKLKGLVASKPSIREIIESTEKGVQDVLKSVKDDVLDVLNYLSTPNGLVYITTDAALTRSSEQLIESFKDEGELELQFNLDTGDDVYECIMKYEDEAIKIIIKCDDQSKEFFITGNGYTQSGYTANGYIEFSVADKGEYIISVDGKYFRAISLK